MDRRLSPGRYRKGELIYTCPNCGREGEQEFINEHLKTAHGIASAKKRGEMMKYVRPRREYINMRDPFPGPRILG